MFSRGNHRRSASPEPDVYVFSQQLDEAYRRTVANFSANDAVRGGQVKGHDTLILTGLDRLEGPPSCIALRDHVHDVLPRVDLPELLLEIHARAGFAHKFTHITPATLSRRPRGSTRGIGLGRQCDCAVEYPLCGLVAASLNTGIEHLRQLLFLERLGDFGAEAPDE